MRSVAKTTKSLNLESLISEVLFKESETVNSETLKAFLKFKLDLEESEATKFLSQVKKVVPGANNNYTLKQVLLAVKNDGVAESGNPFENNIFQDFSKKKGFVEIDMSKF